MTEAALDLLEYVHSLSERMAQAAYFLGCDKKFSSRLENTITGFFPVLDHLATSMQGCEALGWKDLDPHAWRFFHGMQNFVNYLNKAQTPALQSIALVTQWRDHFAPVCMQMLCVMGVQAQRQPREEANRFFRSMIDWAGQEFPQWSKKLLPDRASAQWYVDWEPQGSSRRSHWVRAVHQAPTALLERLFDLGLQHNYPERDVLTALPHDAVRQRVVFNAGFDPLHPSRARLTRWQALETLWGSQKGGLLEEGPLRDYLIDSITQWPRREQVALVVRVSAYAHDSSQAWQPTLLQMEKLLRERFQVEETAVFRTELGLMEASSRAALRHLVEGVAFTSWARPSSLPVNAYCPWKYLHSLTQSQVAASPDIADLSCTLDHMSQAPEPLRAAVHALSEVSQTSLWEELPIEKRAQWILAQWKAHLPQFLDRSSSLVEELYLASQTVMEHEDLQASLRQQLILSCWMGLASAGERMDAHLQEQALNFIGQGCFERDLFYSPLLLRLSQNEPACAAALEQGALQQTTGAANPSKPLRRM